MASLIVLRGAPASGKTTWARAWVEASPLSRARVNRDDLRMQLFGRPAPLDRVQEDAVSKCERQSVKALLRGGYDVVVDATHIKQSYVNDWVKVADECGAKVVVEEFFVALDELLSRDRARIAAGERGVGDEVVEAFHSRLENSGRLGQPGPAGASEGYTYVAPEGPMPNAFIFDIDGTLAHMDGRSPFDMTRVDQDRADHAVAEMARHLARDHHIVIVSGREEHGRALTEEWLERHEITHTRLLMRPTGDNRKDSTVKLEIFRRDIAPHYRVLGVFDDRDQVVHMWRSIGLKCYQVAPGDF